MLKSQYSATTPDAISPEISDFCRRIEPGKQPVWLESQCWPDAELGRCYSNVEEFIADNGGVIQFGWNIWEQSGIYLTAEHHAVARQESRLIDGTPQMNGEQKTLFLPSELPWSGKPVVNKYQALRDTPLANRVCELQRRNLVLFFQGQFGSPEHRRNDNECVGLIERFYEIRRQREQQRRLRQKRR